MAFYASAREKLDVTTWDYGYPFYPGWSRYQRPTQTVTQYTEGSVIVDVINIVKHYSGGLELARGLMHQRRWGAPAP